MREVEAQTVGAHQRAGLLHVLAEPFFVLATQNPIGMEGTYPLPEAQLDRFMFSLRVDYPSEAEEEEIAESTTSDRSVELFKRMTGEEILDAGVQVMAQPPGKKNSTIHLLSGGEKALTADGTAEDRYDGPFFWSPDSSRLVALRDKPVVEGKGTAVRSSPGDQLQPKVETWDYVKPGDPLPWRRPRMSW